MSAHRNRCGCTSVYRAMKRAQRTTCVLLAASCLWLAGGAHAADLLRNVDEAYARRGMARPVLDVRAFEAAEGRFLEELFALTDEAVLLHTEVLRWLASEGERGLHADVYLERIDEVRARLAALEPPARIASVHELVAECLGHQRGFFADWGTALAEGKPFESQLTHEYAYHEGLHRSQRLLLKAYAELRALFPELGSETHAALRSRLRAVNVP